MERLTVEEQIAAMIKDHGKGYVSQAFQKVLTNIEPSMNPCPRCGSNRVGLIPVYVKHAEATEHNFVSLFGLCNECGFRTRASHKHDRLHMTPAAMRIEATRYWNNMVVDDRLSFFEVCEKAFGKEYQHACLDEETYELMLALMKFGMITSRNKRPDRPQAMKDIVSEMADVIICIYQWLHCEHIPFPTLDKVIAGKINRTCHHESVRTAVAELSRKIIEATDINVHTVDASSDQNKS